MSGKEYWVYILRCADGSYYTGVTNDVINRVWQHQLGMIKNCYTYTRRPVKFVYTEWTNDIGAAIYREKQIKRWSRKKKDALARGDEVSLSKYAQGKTGYMKATPLLSPRA